MSQPSDAAKFWFVEPADLRTRLSADYHEATKASAFLFQFGDADPKRSAAMMRTINAVAGRSKSYAYAPQVELSPLDWQHLDAPLGRLLRDRRTNRRLAAAPLGLRELATMLVRGAGITGRIRTGDNAWRDGRAYPSGGGLYPLEIYVVILGVAGVEPGVYHFDPRAACLRRLAARDLRAEATEIFMGETMMAEAGVVFVVTSVFKRSHFKYGERAYRLVNIEAGHLVHNLLLVGQALGLAVVPINGYFDRELEALLDIDGIEESVIYTAVAGIPAA